MKLRITLLVAATLFAACNREARHAQGTPAAKTSTVAVPSDASTVAGATHIEFVRPNYFESMTVGKPGEAAAVTKAEEFGRGETVRTVIQLRMAPSGLAATLEALDGKRDIIYRERKVVPENAKTVMFDWPVSKDWQGDLTIRLLLGADEYATQNIKVTGAAKK